MARWPDQASPLAEAEAALQAARSDQAPLGPPQDDRGCEIIEPALGRASCLGPRPPERVIVHEGRMRLMDGGALRTAEDGGIQHPAVPGNAAFREVWPGMPRDERGPRHGAPSEAGLQGYTRLRGR